MSCAEKKIRHILDHRLPDSLMLWPVRTFQLVSLHFVGDKFPCGIPHIVRFVFLYNAKPSSETHPEAKSGSYLTISPTPKL